MRNRFDKFNKTPNMTQFNKLREMNPAPRNIYYLTFRDQNTGKDLCLRREKKRREGEKNKWEQLTTFTSNPKENPLIRINVTSVDTYTVLDGDFPDTNMLISIDASYKEHVDADLAAKFNQREIDNYNLAMSSTDESFQAEMDAILVEREVVEERLTALERREDELLRRWALKLSVDLKISPEHVAFGSHICDSRKLYPCVYDNHEDPRWDECLLCGLPHERK